jgi:protein-tyrosine phosphatase
MIGYTAHKGMSFDVPFMSEVAENLWQGGCTDGLVLPKYIKHLVSLYPWEAYSVEHELETYMAVRMYDSLDQATDQILDIARWINSCRKTGPVLVHCQAGLNRSSLVAGTALVMNGEVTGRQAVKLLREKRSPACLCNQAFEDWLAGQKKPRNRKPSPQRLDLNADAAA